MVRELGTEILRSYGYRIIDAADGVQALESYQSRGAEIDLVILDLLMPKMSGKETFERLRQMDPTVAILICSGYSSREDDTDPFIDNDIKIVHKPFQPEGLVHAVRQMLDQKKQSGGDAGEKRGVTGKVIAFQRKS
jgi:CheY-like chemotaxis protein